jgi:adenine-specific DNA methylase
MTQQPVLPFNTSGSIFDIFRPIHYLGSKLRILRLINSVIEDVNPGRGRVYDLFAGSGSVAFSLSKTQPVTTVDIQEYSRVICSALLHPSKFTDDVEHFTNKLRTSDLTSRLMSAVDPIADYEDDCIYRAENQDLGPLCEFLETASLITFEKGYASRSSPLLESVIKETSTRLDGLKLSSIATTIIRHFGGLFFSFRQAAQLDALLNSIGGIPHESRDTYLAATLSTASDIVNTVGKHFAQPIKPRDSKGRPKRNLPKLVNRDRHFDVFNLFIEWGEKYQIIPEPKFLHKVLRKDFVDALSDIPADTTVVYADPPYTRDHYSRFYHALETIALRDDPEISLTLTNGQKKVSRGVYRLTRHQSPFCIRSQAEAAFDKLFSEVSRMELVLVLSYSPYDESSSEVHPRVMTINRLERLAKLYFNNVETVSAGRFSHSKLNSTENNFQSSDNGELLFVCRP